MAPPPTSASPCSVFEKQYYIRLVNLILPLFFSPTQSKTDQPPADLVSLLHPEAKLYEFPHTSNPEGRKDYLTAYRASAEPLREFFKDTKYEVMGDMIAVCSPKLDPVTASTQREPREGVASGTRSQNSGASGPIVNANVAVELIWTATVAKDCGVRFKKGMRLKSRISVFFDFHNGKLVEQRNYNCIALPSRPGEPSSSEGRTSG